MDTELPYLLAGGAAFIGGWRRDKGWPKNGTLAVAATIALVIVASIAGNTPLAPMVKALGWVLFAAAVYQMMNEFQKK